MSSACFWGCLVAVLATGCHSSPSPDDLANSRPAHARPTGTVPDASRSPRAQAMRLHDAAMAQMDALNSEQQRLVSQLGKLDLTTPAGQRQAARLRRTVAALSQADSDMMAWMHNVHEPDSTRQPRAQVMAYWQQQLPVLRQVDHLITAALDSARALR